MMGLKATNRRNTKRKSNLSRQISAVAAPRSGSASHLPRSHKRPRQHLEHKHTGLAPAPDGDSAPEGTGDPPREGDPLQEPHIGVPRAAGPPPPPKLLLEKLTQFSLFRDAPHAFFVQIARTLKLVTHHSQEYIIKAGEPAKAMYWILRGSVNVTSPDGEAVHAQLLEGAFFGEIGILFNRPRTATIVANTKVLLGVLTADNFNQLLPDFPAVERQIRDAAQERLAMQDKKKKSGVSSLLNDNAVTPKQDVLPTQVVEDSVSVRDFLHTLPLFSCLPPDLAHKLVLCTEITQTQPYDYIVRLSAPSTDMYFVVSGEVEVLTGDIAGKSERPLARFGRGHIFGDVEILRSLVSDVVHYVKDANVRSVTSCTLLVLTKATLKQLHEDYPTVDQKIIQCSQEHASGHVSGQSSNCTGSSQPNSLREDVFRNPPYQAKRTASEDSCSSSDTRVPASATPPPGISFNPKFSFSSAQPRPVSTTTSLRATSPAAPLDGPLELHVPPMNAVSSNDSFKTRPAAPLHYMPHRKRARLSSIGQGPNRRKSSVLSVGPLPDRILLRCFQFLTLPQLMKLRLVCRRWRQLLYVASCLFDVLDLTPWNNVINDKSLIEITKFVGSRPKVIDISNCFHITDEGFSYMINEIGINGQLRVIKMRSCWEISAMAIMDIAAPSIGSSIEELDLTNCRKVRDDVMQRLLGQRHQPQMGYNHQKPDSSSNWIYPLDEPIPGMESFDSGESRSNGIGCPNIKVLTLRHCKSITDSTLHHIAINTRQTLTALDLTRCTGLTDVGFSYWGYQTFANLEKLVLSECVFLTDNSIRSIANCAPRLRELNLSFCCSLKDYSLEILCMGCPGLEILDLS